MPSSGWTATRRSWGVGLTVLSLLALTACGDDGGEAASTEEGALTVRATADGACAFSGGETAAGFVDLAVVNESDDPLFVITLRLDEGRTFEELEQAPAGLDPPGFATISARTFEPLAPGTERTEELAFVEAGEYAVVCATDKPPTEIPVLAPEPLSVTD